MTRRAETGLIIAAALLASIGVAIVEFTNGDWLDAQVALTFLAFAGSFGGIHLATVRWAPGGSSLLVPMAAFLTAIGFIEIYRLDSHLAALQRWSLLVAAAVGALILWLLRDSGVAVLRRYRYVLLALGIGFLLLPPASRYLADSRRNRQRLATLGPSRRSRHEQDSQLPTR